MGRWKSECPIQLSPDKNKSEWAFRNDFNFGGDAKNCSFAAHVRKTHIRGGADTSRIARRGISYGEDFVRGASDNGRDLLFTCYQSTSEDGYGLIQKAWADNPNFPVPGKSGIDVTIGQGSGIANPFFVGTRSAPINPANDFVTTKGGEYLFAPSINHSKNGFNISKLPKGLQSNL